MICPCCGDKRAVEIFMRVDCSTPTCRNYSAKISLVGRRVKFICNSSEIKFDPPPGNFPLWFELGYENNIDATIIRHEGDFIWLREHQWGACPLRAVEII